MKTLTLRGMSAIALLALTCLATRAQDKNQEDLLKEVQALNNIRSEEAIQKKLKELGEDKKLARKLVHTAAPLLAKKEESTFTYSGAHILGTLAADVREYKTAIDFLVIAMEKANKVKSIRKVCWNRLTLIELYLADNRPTDAEKLAQKHISYNPSDIEEEDDMLALGATKFYAANYLVRAQMQQGRFDDANKQIDKLYKLVEAGQYGPPAKNVIQRTHAQLHTYKGDLKDAIKVYELLIDASEKDEEKARLKEVIGNLEADAGNVDKAYEILSELLKKKPDQPGLNNDLGYILASHDRKLDEAEKMIRKAVEAEPENSSFLDSMAWVLFKQKKYKEAKEYMLKAVAQERGKNTELMEHLGDIQLALGDKAEAKKAYEAALAAVTFNYKDQARKPELEKKLKSIN